VFPAVLDDAKVEEAIRGDKAAGMYAVITHIRKQALTKHMLVSTPGRPVLITLFCAASALKRVAASMLVSVCMYQLPNNERKQAGVPSIHR